MCRTCRSYRPLSGHERATLDAFIEANQPAQSANADEGVTLGRDLGGRLVRLPSRLRHRHLYLIGKPGTGKATLMKNLIVQDMVAGRGCAVLDLDGDLAVDLLGCVPPARLPVVTYFAPASGHGPTFNPLALPHSPQVLADGIVDVFKRFFTDGWEPQVEQVLRFGLLTLLGDRAPHTLADLYTFYVAPAYRAALAESSPSPRLRAFWQHEFATIEAGSIRCIADRLAVFLRPLSPLERLFSIAESTLDFEEIIDRRQVFVANLSRNALGDEPAALLAGLLVRAVAQAAQTCAERGRDEHPEFFLYLPEFQDQAPFRLDALLSELTKNRVSLTWAHQRRGEQPDSLSAAILASVGTIAAFQVDPADAVQLKGEMSARCVARASTGTLYDHDAARRAAIEPVLARARKLLASGRIFADDDQLHYPGSRVEEILADIERVRDVPKPADLTEIDWPTSNDFTTLEPLRAFLRIERAHNVTALTVEPPPVPDAQTRAKILDRPRRRELSRGHVDAKAAAAPHPGRGKTRPQPPKRWRRAIRTLKRRTR